MILTCPNCGTQYVVKDGAIPTEGRQVRCAACKHSWHQDPDPTSEALAPEFTEAAPVVQAAEAAQASPPAEVPADPPEESDAEDESFAEATMIAPRSGPEAEERAYEEAVVEGEAEPIPAEPQAREAERTESDQTTVATQDWNEPPDAEAEAGPDMFSPFAPDGEVEPKKRSALATIAIIALLVVIAAAAFWFFAPPEMKAKLGLAGAGATPLQLVTTHMDRQPLESGNELLTVTGRVINPSAKEQDVPPIQAQLKDKGGKVVYSWTIQPPARSLAAGASASFNSAEVNVPPGGDELTITLGDPKA
jgi:predicted Zn finger-like uncharacterized protein